MKILITGGNGFIGRNLCAELKTYEDVKVAIAGESATAVDDICAFSIDLRNSKDVEAMIASYQPDVIVHLAAIAVPTYNNLGQLYEINVGGTENLLEAAEKTLQKGTKIFLASSAGVYGNAQVDLIDEGQPHHPVNHYSCSKMVMEHLARQYEEYLEIHIVRPFNIIGSGQSNNFLISKLIHAFVNREPEIKMGNLTPVRDYVPVEYCAKVFTKLILGRNPIPKILNICSGVGHSCQDILNILQRITGHSPNIISTNEFVRKNEIWRLVGDPTRVLELMDGQRPENLESTLEKMLSMESEQLFQKNSKIN